MTLDNDVLIKLMGVATSVSLFVLGLLFRAQRHQQKRADRLADKVGDLAEKVSALETKIGPFWDGLVGKMAHILHSPHTPELDRLLERSSALEASELRTLVGMLRALEDDKAERADRRGCAAMLVLGLAGRYNLTVVGGRVIL